MHTLAPRLNDPTPYFLGEVSVPISVIWSMVSAYSDALWVVLLKIDFGVPREREEDGRKDNSICY